MTSENKNMQGQLDLVWKQLLPGIDAKTTQNADLSRFKRLTLATQEGRQTAPAAISKKFKLETNDLGLQEASFAFGDNGCTFAADHHTIICGFETWQRCQANFPGTPPRLISGGMPKQSAPSKIAASAAWTDDRTLIMQWRYYETPHSDTVTCRFDDDNVTISFLNSITAMNPQSKDVRVPLKGKAVS